MRKVKFQNDAGKIVDGYFVGIAGTKVTEALLVVEDENGKVYTVRSSDVTFTSKPPNMTPVKRLDLKLMRNALVGINHFDMERPYKIEDFLKLAEEKNIIIEDTEGFD